MVGDAQRGLGWVQLHCRMGSSDISPRTASWPSFSEELGDAVGEVHGRLVLAKGRARPVAWVANVWCDPVRIPIASIGDAAKKLRAIQRNWALYSVAFHRRAALIEEKLPKVSAKPIVFGAGAPKAPLGSWTLIDADTILASPHCSSPFPNGEVHFVEDRAAPPSRAYLKLWELFTLLDERPKPGEHCLDLGASPGGWTLGVATARRARAQHRQGRPG